MPLTESQTLERAGLEIKREASGLDADERWRLKALSQTHPLPSYQLSLGARIATGLEYKRLAVKPPHESATVDEPIALTTIGGAEFKTLLATGSSTSVGAFQSLDRGGYEPVRRPYDVLDLARIGSTTEGAVEYARQTTYTSVAVEVSEATSTSTGTKSEASLPFEKVTETVQSISAWAPATRRVLADVAEMRDLINEQLTFDCRQRLEAQALAGNGTAPNLRGLDGTTGVQTQAKGADSTPLALAKGAAKVFVAGWKPTAVVLHPNDWTDAVGTMITAGGSLSQTLELPVVVTAAAPEGTGYVGDWKQLAIWIRDVEFFVSIAHSNWFTLNIAAALAEVRAAIGVLAAAAFCRVTGIGAMRPSFEELVARGRSRERVEVYERLPPAELVASKDILRRDPLGRTLVACPRGTVPPAWLQLSDAERDSLVDPPPPLPTGYMHPGPYGFSPEGVRIGFVVEGCADV